MRCWILAALVAAAHLATSADPARAAKRTGFDPAQRVPSGLSALVRGPQIWPGAVVSTDGAGRLRTLELDDTAPLRLRLTIPF